MSFDLDTSALANEVLAARTAEALDPVMLRLANSTGLVKARGVRNHRLFMPELDQTVPHMARLLRMRDRPSVKSNDNVVILASQVYPIGGHSRVMGDISRLIGADKVTIILTDIYKNVETRHVLDTRLPELGYYCRAFLLMKSANLVDRTAELYSTLAAINPTRIFLFNHHMDYCAVAAAWPFRDIVDYMHHGDSLPCAGASLPWSEHADLTFSCHIACRDSGLPAQYVSMPPPKAPSVQRAQWTDKGLLFATCGQEGKYMHPAKYKWGDWVVAALQHPDSSIVHIGPVSDELRGHIQSAMMVAGIALDRYEFVGLKPSLSEELLTRGVDIYLGSYPEGGGRANLEATSVGVPVIHPAQANAAPFSTYTNPLPSWVRVTEPSEMPAAIAACRRLRRDMAEPAFAAKLADDLGRFETFLSGATVPEADRSQVFGVPLYEGASS